jgi:hypothetical protein
LTQKLVVKNIPITVPIPDFQCKTESQGEPNKEERERRGEKIETISL